jgi:hypothetical protein
LFLLRAKINYDFPMRSFGKSQLTEIEVFSLHAASLTEASAELVLTTKYLTALIVCDSDQFSVDEISNFAKALLEKGAVYLCFWGKGCERFHDMVDEVEVEMETLGKSCPARHDGTLMTTWHNDESLDQALWFLLSCAWPLDNEIESCSTVDITIGNESWANSVASRLGNMEQFRKEISDAD